MATSNTGVIIKRSFVTAIPPYLEAGEIAYSYVSNTMFIGTADSDGALNIGGQFYTQTIDSATTDSIANTLVKRDSTGAIRGTLIGVANSALKLQNARTISISGGDITASNVEFDGTQNVNFNATLSTISGLTPGIYGGDKVVPIIQVAANGRVISVSNTPGAAAISVGTTDANNEISNVISNVTGINFDTTTGFKVDDLGSGNVKVSLGSSFKTWKVDGQSDLVAVAEDTVRFGYANGIVITTDPNSDPKSITFDGGPIFETANAAFNEATAANTLAQAAFDAANNSSSGSAIDQFARDAANTAASNTVILQGVNLTQNASITALQGVNDTQNSNITVLQSVNDAQNNSIIALQSVNDIQNTSISILQGVNLTQNSSITFLQGINDTQNTSISILQGVNLTQNASITALQSVNDTQNNSITFLQSINDNQNTSISVLQSVNDIQNNSIAAIQSVNDIQNTNIQSVNTFSISAYNHSNSVNTLTHAAFNTANVGYSFVNSGGTVTGNVSINGNLNVTGNIEYTGNVSTILITGNTGQFFGNTTTGFGALYTGISTGFVYQPETVLQASSNFDGYAQINHQNINAGSNASADIVATADNGNINDTFIDFGINSSTYNQELYNLTGPNDGYVYVAGNTVTNGGNLILATMTAKDIIFATSGQQTDNEVMRITSSNTVVIKSTESTTGLTSGALQVVGGIGTQGDVQAVNVYSQGTNILQYVKDVNLTQNTWISSNVAYLQGGLNTANSNITYILNVLTSQNTNIQSVNTFSISAYNKANSASDKADSASSNTVFLQGINDTQNTSITSVNTYSFAAFSAANNRVLKAGDSITGTLNISSGIASTKPNTGSLLVTGGVGVSDSIYVGNRVGFSNTSNVSMVYQYYNAATNSLDTVFG